MLAMVALALMPTFSQAIAASRGQNTLAEVCTAQGMRVVALTADASDVDTEPARTFAAHAEHCPFCGHSTATVGMPPLAAAMVTACDATTAMPALSFAAPYTFHAWRASQPRGPPALS